MEELRRKHLVTTAKVTSGVVSEISITSSFSTVLLTAVCTGCAATNLKVAAHAWQKPMPSIAT